MFLAVRACVYMLCSVVDKGELSVDKCALRGSYTHGRLIYEQVMNEKLVCKEFF